MANSLPTFIELFDNLKQAILEGDTEKIVELQGKARAMTVTGRFDPSQAYLLANLNRGNLFRTEMVVETYRSQLR